MAILALAVLLPSQLIAIRSDYGLKTVGDNLVHFASVRQLARDPFDPSSPLFGGGRMNHFGPFMIVLGLVHRWSGTSDSADALASELAIVGAVVVALVLAAFFFLARAFLPGRSALVATALLPLSGAPFLVIWAGDVSWHGFAYASFFPQMFAFGALFATLGCLARERRGGPPWWLAGAGAAYILLLTSHGLTALLATPLVGFACGLARRSLREGLLLSGGVSLLALLALLVPGDLEHLPGWMKLVLVALPPLGALVGWTALRMWPVAQELPRYRPWRLLVWLNVLLIVVYVFAAHAGGIYLTQERIPQWIVLLAVPSLGFLALRPFLPWAWATGCVLLFLLGAVGLPVPFYWRFAFFAVPAACLVAAAVLTRETPARRATVVLVVACLVAVQGVAAVQPGSLYDAPVHPGFGVAAVLPPGSGTILTDPHTASFVVGTSGHRVATHRSDVVLDRDDERNADGFRLLQRLAAEGASNATLEAIRAAGVDWILVNTNVKIGDSVDFYSYWNTTVDGAFFVESADERASNLRLVEDLQRRLPLVGKEGPYFVFQL